MNKKIKKFIKIFKSINLSEKEKSILRYKISEFISFNPIRNEVHAPKKSFYFSIFTFRAISKGIAMALVVILVVGGSSVSYASTDALPGDALYPVKINVNEKIEEKLAFTSEAKVNVQTEKVERRLSEAQKLVEKKDFSQEKKEIVKANLKKNVDEVTKTIENLKDEGNIKKALETTSKISPVLEAHKKVLAEQQVQKKSLESETTFSIKTMSENGSENYEEENEESLLDSVDEAIKKVEEVEKRVIEKANENKEASEKATERNTEEVNKLIESLKKENIQIGLEAKKEAEKIEAQNIKTEENNEIISSEKDISTEEDTSTDIESEKIENDKITPELSSLKMMVPAVKIVSQTDAELKVKEAEELLKKAVEAQTSGDFKTALTLSQEAKKIISQIEEYKKIKSLEAESGVKEVEKSQLIQKTEIKSPTQTTDVKLNETTEIKTTPVETKTSTDVKTQIQIKTVDIKAEAIRSLEETNASFKKINLSQSVQNRLLP